MKNKLTATRLREAIDKRGISQRELALKASINESSVSQYLSGTFSPGNVSAKKLADVLGVDPMWLMGFDETDYSIGRPVVGLLDQENPNMVELVNIAGVLSQNKLDHLIEYAKFLQAGGERDE